MKIEYKIENYTYGIYTSETKKSSQLSKFLSVPLPSSLFTKQTNDFLREIKDADLEFFKIIKESTNIEQTRSKIFEYLNKKENKYFDLSLDENRCSVNISERANSKECIRILKNIFRTENEKLTKHSALQKLIHAIQNRANHQLTHAFLSEILYLLYGANGRGLTHLPVEQDQQDQDFLSFHESTLNKYSESMERAFQSFSKSNGIALSSRQEKVKEKILAFLNAKEADWNDHTWQYRNVFRKKESISAIVSLSPDEIAGLVMAEKENIPVQITPYYLSLFNPDGRDETDMAIRAQVLPGVTYCKSIAASRNYGINMDYMGEHYTSPIDNITRRYPSIAILKPYDSCPQICIYCQRNWEIQDIEHGTINDNKTTKAIKWIAEHEEIKEVLVTGGDPLTLSNSKLAKIIDQLSDIEHIDRIRIGTRTIVTAPMRIDDGFINLLKAYHKPGTREIVIMTHVEHPSELTNDVMSATSKIKQCGISIYNQQVFTYYNSKKYESAYLRKQLRLFGIDPYYTFNTKGKDETIDFRVPISRLLQERKEEARLLPGVCRTDEPVFNVPRVGKSHLRAWQEHEPIMILSDGRRVYRFLTWDCRLRLAKDYLYKDVAIFDYLKRLHLDGEDVNSYRSIWYYF